jgi:hypothetical protein
MIHSTVPRPNLSCRSISNVANALIVKHPEIFGSIEPSDIDAMQKAFESLEITSLSVAISKSLSSDERAKEAIEQARKKRVREEQIKKKDEIAKKAMATLGITTSPLRRSPAAKEPEDLEFNESDVESETGLSEAMGESSLVVREKTLTPKDIISNQQKRIEYLEMENDIIKKRNSYLEHLLIENDIDFE